MAERTAAVIRLRGELDGGVDELTALADWLRQERVLRGSVRLVARAPRPGELGGAFELITVALGAGGVGAALAESLSVWLGNRRSDVKVSVSVGDRTVEVEASRVADAPALIREVLAEAARVDAASAPEAPAQDPAAGAGPGGAAPP
ncbi:hypothetical protein OG216_26525 [Streptomycetaceae bacterium NBC_01309]